MRKEDLYKAIGDISEQSIAEVQMIKKKKPAWVKWGALAACLCLLIAIPVVLHHPAETPHEVVDPSSDATGPAGLTVNGIKYLISSYVSVADELPAGFSHAGETDVGGFENCPYYVNADMPEWVYVRQEVLTDGTVDATGTLNRTEPHDAYVRYVDVRLRGKDLVCYNGEHYISIWSATPSGAYPDVSREYYEAMENEHSIRIEGDVPDGFISAGTAEFTGQDTVPRGTLSSNQGAHEVYINPDEPDVVLVPTYWHTHTKEEGKETRHEGFDIYIRYDCPLA